MMRNYAKDALIVFLLLALVYAYFFQNPGANGNSRFNLIFAAVQEGRLAIDSFHDRDGTQTTEKAYHDGHYYSDKAIGPSLVGGFLYVPLYGMYRLFHHPSLYFAKWILTFLVVGIPSAAAGSVMFLLSRHWSQSRWRAFGVAMAIGLGTLGLPYGVVFYSHQFAASLCFFAFFLMYRMKEDPGTPANGYVFLIGLLLGWALISEYPTAVIVLALAGYYGFVIAGRYGPRRWRMMVLPVLGGLLPIFLQAMYNRLCFGDFLSIGYGYESNPVFVSGMRQGLMGIRWPDAETMFYMTFHPTVGLFWQSPVLLLSVVGAGFLLRKHPRRAELILAVCVICAYIAVFSGYYMWWGGWAVGVRHLIPILPFFCIPLSLIPRRLDGVFAGLCAVSVEQMLIAAARTISVPETMVLRIRRLGFLNIPTSTAIAGNSLWKAVSPRISEIFSLVWIPGAVLSPCWRARPD